MNKYILLLILFLYSGTIHAQEKFTISRYVKDAGTGEELVGVSVYVEKLNTGCIANNYGFYSLTIPAGTLHGDNQ